MRKLLKAQSRAPRAMVTDKLRFYDAAKWQIQLLSNCLTCVMKNASQARKASTDRLLARAAIWRNSVSYHFSNI